MFKAAKIRCLKFSSQGRKFVNPCEDERWLNGGDHFAIYTNIESCIPETNIILYVINNISITKRQKNSP